MAGYVCYGQPMKSATKLNEIKIVSSNNLSRSTIGCNF